MIGGNLISTMEYGNMGIGIKNIVCFQSAPILLINLDTMVHHQRFTHLIDISLKLSFKVGVLYYEY
eukprot:snap_masked-scaffold_2-processed-gene-14.22-mRNA-1 protein AED:1.00 eAED:1.00 QI:0/0/0/0/1/1/2/0/65